MNSEQAARRSDDASDALRVVQLTDLHLRVRPHMLYGIDVEHSLQRVLQHLRAHHWPADLVLATGDLVHDERSAYRRVVEVLTPLQTPVYCLPGNHDEALGLAAELSDGAVRRERRVLAGGWQILLLDSSIAGAPGGRLGADELAFADAALSEHPRRPALVCLHHNPQPVDSAWLDTMTLADADALFALLARHRQTRALLFGHIHQHYDENYRGLRLLGTPSTCAQFAPGRDSFAIDDRPPGYRWLRLYRDGRLDTGVERVADHDRGGVPAS